MHFRALQTYTSSILDSSCNFKPNITESWTNNQAPKKLYQDRRERLGTACSVTGWQWELHIEDVCSVYVSPNVIYVTKSWRMKWFGYEAHTDKLWYAYTILVWKPERRRTFGIPTQRLVNDMNLIAKWQQCVPHAVTGMVYLWVL